MMQPFPESTETVKYFSFHSGVDLAKEIFWRSSAELMGAALELVYGDQLILRDNPVVLENGFFYDFLLLDPSTIQDIDRGNKRDLSYQERIDELCRANTEVTNLHFISMDDTLLIRKKVLEIAKERYPFEYMDVSYDFARNLFVDNPFKLHLLDRIQKENGLKSSVNESPNSVKLFKVWNTVGICQGPLFMNTKQMQCFVPTSVSSAHWTDTLIGNDVEATAELLQQRSPVFNRLHAISFPEHEMYKRYEKMKKEVAWRDHRAIGKTQKLFMMHPWAPGSGFILPHGQRMVNTIMSAIRREYAKYGFDEVSSPLMYNRKLWETSGHWEKYREDMFTISPEALSTKASVHAGCCGHQTDKSRANTTNEPEFGLKPMNCPGHCLIYASELRSYRDLPIRYADFSPLHRNEIAGALTGLTRVRKFHQDDGHIFCTREQVQNEIESCLRMVESIYGIFGFNDYELALSTRPANYIGELSEWDEAEEALKEALGKSSRQWILNKGDGAFYGPKIDVRVQDVLGRKHQTATIQLDFQLPQRFELKYAGADRQLHQPVMIHRAVLGSMERMLAILIEHWGGKWPFWVSPRQAIVIPTTTNDSEGMIAKYAQKVRDELANDKTPESVDSHRYFVDVNLSGDKLSSIIRAAQLAQYNFMLVVGEQEMGANMVDVRHRNGNRVGKMTIPEVKAMFQDLVETYK
ncbi:hypothetical protein EDC05_001253 [Coemansia umbellata]|nr:hypothetical protein EDC05_001253 [Coemansia umbellata]